MDHEIDNLTREYVDAFKEAVAAEAEVKEIHERIERDNPTDYARIEALKERADEAWDRKYEAMRKIDEAVHAPYEPR